MSPAAERPRRRAQTWAFTIAFLGLAIGNATFAWVAAERARNNAAPGEEPDYGLAWGIAIGGGVAVVGLLVILVITLRQQRRLATANQALEENGVRSRGLQEVAGRLARALAGDDVVAALLDHVPTAVAAEAAAVIIRTDAGRLERLTHDPAAEPVEVPHTPGGVIDRVLTEQEPAWLQSPLGWRGDETADRLAEGAWAMAVVPLLADEWLGLLVVS